MEKKYQEALDKIKELYNKEKFEVVANEFRNYNKSVNRESPSEKETWYKSIVELATFWIKNKETPQAYYLLGVSHHQLNEYDKAINNYNKLIKLKPDYQYAYYNRGTSYAFNKEFDKAIDDFTQAIENDPKNARAYNNRGMTYENITDFDHALKDYESAIEIDLQYSKAYHNLARLYRKKNEVDKIKNTLKELIRNASGQNSYYVEWAKSELEEIEDAEEIRSIDVMEKLREVEGYCKKIKALLQYKDDVLTHYTSFSTTRILIERIVGKFRISEATYMNDPSEGRQLYKHLNLIDGAENNGNADKYFEKPFIGSFVHKDQNNDLSLWRMYGKEQKEEAQGCSITINLASMLEPNKDNLKRISISDSDELGDLIAKTDKQLNISENLPLYRVAYRMELKNKKYKFNLPGAKIAEEDDLNKLINKLQDRVKELLEKKNEEPGIVTKIKKKLKDIIYLFKSAEYLPEKEVRLVTPGFGFDKQINDQRTPPSLYIELGSIKKYITNVTLGPKIAHADEWAAYFHHLMQQINGNKDAEIHISKLPYK